MANRAHGGEARIGRNVAAYPLPNSPHFGENDLSSNSPPVLNNGRAELAQARNPRPAQSLCQPVDPVEGRILITFGQGRIVKNVADEIIDLPPKG